MPGDCGRFLIHSEVSFSRLSVGCEANHFSTSLAVGHLLPRGFDGGLSFVGRKCRVRPPIFPKFLRILPDFFRAFTWESRWRRAGVRSTLALPPLEVSKSKDALLPYREEEAAGPTCRDSASKWRSSRHYEPREDEASSPERCAHQLRQTAQ